MADPRDPPCRSSNAAPGVAEWERANLAAAEPGFQRGDYEDFVALLGKDRATSWLVRLERTLGTAFAEGDGTPEDLRKAAHAMVALAGIPGFADFARQCTALEHAIAGKSAYREQLATVRRDSIRVAAVVSALRTDLAAEVPEDPL